MIKVILRNISAVLVGLAVGIVMIVISENLNTRFHPLPAGVTRQDATAMNAYMQSLPTSLLAIMLLEYFVAFTLAIYLATRLSLSAHFRQGVLVAAFFGASSYMNLHAFSHPAWFWAGNFLVLFAAVWLGVRMGVPKLRATHSV